MSFYRFANKVMIFDMYSYLVGDIKSVLLTDILDPVDKLAGDAFVPQVVGYSKIKGDSEFAVVSNLPAGNVFRDYLNIFGCKNYLLSIDCNRMIPVVFKSYNLLWCKRRDGTADLFHQFAISRTKCLKIGFYLLNKNRCCVINIFDCFNIDLSKYQIFYGFKLVSEAV